MNWSLNCMEFRIQGLGFRSKLRNRRLHSIGFRIRV